MEPLLGCQELDKSVFPMQKLCVISELSVLLSNRSPTELGGVDTALTSLCVAP